MLTIEDLSLGGKKVFPRVVKYDIGIDKEDAMISMTVLRIRLKMRVSAREENALGH